VELKGNLRNFPLPDIVQLIGSARRTGLLLITIGGNRASIFFEEGNRVHTEYRDLVGQAVLNRLLQEEEGGFQFLADVQTQEHNFVADWMSAIIEAARISDEAGRDHQDGLEALDAEFVPGATDAPKPAPRPAWDASRVKERVREALHQAFGKKAVKIEKELEKCPDTKLGLLDFCTKAEKYIYVFLDSARAKPVADGLRNIVEEP
jgi:hypothetical protein